MLKIDFLGFIDSLQMKVAAEKKAGMPKCMRSHLNGIVGAGVSLQLVLTVDNRALRNHCLFGSVEDNMDDLDAMLVWAQKTKTDVNSRGANLLTLVIRMLKNPKALDWQTYAVANLGRFEEALECLSKKPNM